MKAIIILSIFLVALTQVTLAIDPSPKRFLAGIFTVVDGDYNCPEG